MKTKATFSLEKLLEEVLYKEHVQGLLEAYGESSSGQKPELIDRFLNSERVHSKDVETIVKEILEEVPVADLRDLGHRMEIKLPATKGGMVRHLMKNVSFESCVREIERDCPVCRAKTAHELHFTTDWRASYFRCSTCNNRIDVAVLPGLDGSPQIDEPKTKPPAMKGSEMSPEMSYTLSLVENIAPTVRRIAEQQANTTQATLNTLASIRGYEELSRNQALASGQGIAALEALRIREERESHEKLAHKIDRGTLWTIAALLFALGLGIPSLGTSFDEKSSLVYTLLGILFLVIGGILVVHLMVTSEKKHKSEDG